MYIYIYLYLSLSIYIGGLGELNREIGFVSSSFLFRVVRASGRGEAAWACEAMCFPTLVARLATFPPPARLGRGFGSGLFVAICKGFKDCAEILLLCARVLRIRNTD